MVFRRMSRSAHRRWPAGRTAASKAIAMRLRLMKSGRGPLSRFGSTSQYVGALNFRRRPHPYRKRFSTFRRSSKSRFRRRRFRY